MKTTIVISLAFLCLSGAGSNAQAVVPPPDGGYPNFTTAEGTKALQSLTTGSANTAVGWYSLFANSTGSYNTAVGAGALDLNAADNNTATGAAALLLNTTGNNNTANGTDALVYNDSGSFNTAVGIESLFYNTTGGQNTAVGRDALANNTTGSQNIAMGSSAGVSLVTGDYNIDIGNFGVFDEAYTIRIGDGDRQTATYIAGISGAVVPGGVTVIIDSNGHVGTVVSSQRFKDQIKPMDKASEAIFALKPVTFRYKQKIDPKGIPQFGLVAEEVEKVNPDLVARDKEGKPYSVRYDQVNAMLLNEFLKEHRRMEEQDKRIEELTAQLKQQAAQIQKVRAQLQASKPAPQVVNNP